MVTEVYMNGFRVVGLGEDGKEAELSRAERIEMIALDGDGKAHSFILDAQFGSFNARTLIDVLECVYLAGAKDARRNIRASLGIKD